MEISKNEFVEAESIFGEKTASLKVGRVTIIVRVFKLKQIDSIKELISELYKAGIEKKKFFQAMPGESEARVTEYEDHSWAKAFLSSDDLLGRFLDQCVTVEMNETDGKGRVNVREMPLPLTMEVFEQAFSLNEDFFRRFMAFVSSAESFISKLQGRTEAQDGQTAETIPEPKAEDLTQPDTPVGQRSPLLFVQPESPTNDSQT